MVGSEAPIVVCPNCGAKNRVDLSKAGDRQPVCGRCKTPLPAPDSANASAGHPIEATDANFEQLLASAG